jgi:hypothetical protein
MKPAPFVKLNVDVASSPKLLGVGPEARWLWVVGVVVAGRDLSDGHIRPAVVVAEADVNTKAASVLVKAGLWHEASHGCTRCPEPRAPGWAVVHDYLDYQQSRAQVEERAERMREGGRRGAASRWGGS